MVYSFAKSSWFANTIRMSSARIFAVLIPLSCRIVHNPFATPSSVTILCGFFCPHHSPNLPWPTLLDKNVLCKKSLLIELTLAAALVKQPKHCEVIFVVLKFCNVCSILNKLISSPTPFLVSFIFKQLASTLLDARILPLGLHKLGIIQFQIPYWKGTTYKPYACS